MSEPIDDGPYKPVFLCLFVHPFSPLETGGMELQPGSSHAIPFLCWKHPTVLFECSCLRRGQTSGHRKTLHEREIFHRDKLIRTSAGCDRIQNQLHVAVLRGADWFF